MMDVGRKYDEEDGLERKTQRRGHLGRIGNLPKKIVMCGFHYGDWFLPAVFIKK